MDEHDLSLNIPATDKPRVVIIGGGFGGLNVAKHLPKGMFQVVLFDKHNYHTFQPLLYQVATAGLQPDAIASPLRHLFKNLDDFYFRLFKISAIDPEQQIVFTPAGDLHYDYLIIAAGSVSNYYGNDELAQQVLPLKSIPDSLNLRSQLMQVFEKAEMTKDAATRASLLSFVIVGGGPTGVETAGALAELRKKVLPKDYPCINFSEMKIYLVEGMSRLLPPMSQKAGARAQHDLEKMGVKVIVNAMVDSYDGQTLYFKNNDPVQTSTVVWSAGVKSVSIEGIHEQWLEKGRLLTDKFCRVMGTGNIFAVGDIALMKTDKYPKGHPGVAQVAIQMGKFVGKNLARIHKGERVDEFNYFDKGTLATIGRGKAVLDFPGNRYMGGRVAWWIWLFVHINYLISFRNKLMVFASWIWNYFTFDKGNRLIIRPYIKRKAAMGRVVTSHE